MGCRCMLFVLAVLTAPSVAGVGLKRPVGQARQAYESVETRTDGVIGLGPKPMDQAPPYGLFEK